MRQAIKEYLKNYPLAFAVARRFSRLLPPVTIQGLVRDGLKGKPGVFFVQIGSNDGLGGDPIRDLILRNTGWRGIFIEPVSFLYQRLRQNYSNSDRFIFENVAIGAERCARMFYYVRPDAQKFLGEELPPWHDQLGSFDRQHILNHLGAKIEPYIAEETIECYPLQEIFSRNGVRNIDLLHVDTEGFDYQVISQVDFDRYRPPVILYEHKHLPPDERDQARTLLKTHGYGLTECDCGDTVAVLKG